MDRERIVKFFEESFDLKVEDLSKPFLWNGFEVYQAAFVGGPYYQGLPPFALVDGDSIRFANRKEVFEIFDFIKPDTEEPTAL